MTSAPRIGPLLRFFVSQPEEWQRARAVLGVGASAVLGGLYLGAIDAAYAAAALRAQLEETQPFVELGLRLSLLPGFAVSLLGVLQILATTALLVAARRLGAGAAAVRRAAGWLVAAALLPFFYWVSGQMFLGARAQRIPGRPILSVLIFALAALAVRLIVPPVLAAIAAARQRRLRGLVGGLGVAALVVPLYLIDARVLPRLYSWFHISIEIVMLALAQLAAALLLAVLGATVARRESRWSGGRWRGFPVAALASFALVCAGLLLGDHARERIERAQVLRSLVAEKTVLGSQFLRGRTLLIGPGGRGNRRLRLGGSGLATTASAPEPSEEARPMYGGPHFFGRDVFLITVDALRGDRLRAPAMPYASALAEKGVRFSRAYTQVPHTSFAVATLLTGKPVYALLTLGQGAESHETLPTVLRRFRYKTAAFYPPSVFFVEHEKLKGLEDSAYGFEYVKYEYLDGARRTDQVLAFLAAESPPQVFVWVHYLEPHEPYDAHPGGPGKERSDLERYDGEVAYVDHEIARLCEHLRRTRPGALIIIAADHGEEFGEHGGRYHGTTLYDEQSRVPLAFAELSPQLLSPRTYDAPVGLIDVAPTILGLLDIERSARMRGRDLSPWLLSGAAALPQRPVYSEIGRKKAVVSGDRKLICDFSIDSCQLFNLTADPREQRNILPVEPQSGAALRQALDRYVTEAQLYEQSPQPGAAGRAAVLSRARMGDRAAIPELVRLLLDDRSPAEARAEVLTWLGQLVGAAPPERAPASAVEPALKDEKARQRLLEIVQSGERPSAGWAALVLLRSDDPSSETPLLPAIRDTVIASINDDKAPAEQRLAAALSLAESRLCSGAKPKTADPDCVALYLSALPPTMGLDDPERARPLLLILGRSRDARVVAPLVEQLSAVRSRTDIAVALGSLGLPAGRRAIGELSRLLAEDPYVPVRAAAASSLRTLAKGADSFTRSQITSALATALRSEREPPVRAALTDALSALM